MLHCIVLMFHVKCDICTDYFRHKPSNKNKTKMTWKDANFVCEKCKIESKENKPNTVTDDIKWLLESCNLHAKFLMSGVRILDCRTVPERPIRRHWARPYCRGETSARYHHRTYPRSNCTSNGDLQRSTVSKQEPLQDLNWKHW